MRADEVTHGNCRKQIMANAAFTVEHYFSAPSGLLVLCYFFIADHFLKMYFLLHLIIYYLFSGNIALEQTGKNFVTEEFKKR